MDGVEILERIELGEDSTTQFKENSTNNTALAEEMVAFSNALGGLIIIGVKDNGEIIGLSADELLVRNTDVNDIDKVLLQQYY